MWVTGLSWYRYESFVGDLWELQCWHNRFEITFLLSVLFSLSSENAERKKVLNACVQLSICHMGEDFQTMFLHKIMDKQSYTVFYMYTQFYVYLYCKDIFLGGILRLQEILYSAWNSCTQLPELCLCYGMSTYVWSLSTDVHDFRNSLYSSQLCFCSSTLNHREKNTTAISDVWLICL